MNFRGNAQKKKWPMYCLFAAIALAVLAGTLYFVYSRNISSEFGHNKAYFGEAFDELYALSELNADFAESIVAKGRDALNTIGDGEEFGLLSRYCIDPTLYPDAVCVEAELEVLNVGERGLSGYIWVAYHQRAYDENGELVTASGTEESRILSRWSLKKIDGVWAVSEIREKP